MLLFYLSMLDITQEKSVITDIYHRYLPMMKHIAYRILRNNEAAEDAVQDAMIRIIEWIRLEQPELCQVKWDSLVGVIVRNVALDTLRKQARCPTDSLEDEGVTLPPVWDQHASLETLDMHAVLMQLPREYAEILQLHYQQDMSPRDIAPLLGISRENARVRLHRATQAFAKEWRKQNVDFE